MRPSLRAALIVFACHAACASPSVVPAKDATTGRVAEPVAPVGCRSDDDCVLSPVDCSECGRCPGDEPWAVMRAEVDSLRAECERHPPVRLDPHAASLGLQSPACAPCPLGLDEPRPLWRAICRDGGCGVVQAGIERPDLGQELTRPSAP